MRPFTWSFGWLGQDARYSCWMILLILVWTFELFWVQDLTLRAVDYCSDLAIALFRALRFGLDLVVISAVVFLSPRWLQAVIQGGALVFYAVVAAYTDYFGQPLTATVIAASTTEGVAVFSAGLEALPAWFPALLGTLGVKLLAIHRAGARPRVAWRLRARSGFLLIALFPLALWLLNGSIRPFERLRDWGTVGGIGAVYGYTPTWVAELYYLDNDALLERALARAEIRSDALRPMEAPLPVRDRLVFLQVESLDYALLGFTIGGSPVTPNLDRLVERSMLFAVQADKQTGSADTDFIALMGRLPSSDVPTYKIEGYPYEDSFVHALVRRGFETTVVHGVSGEFFNRRQPFEQMGFQNLYFREEFAAGGYRIDGWALLDEPLLRFSSRLLRKAEGRQFQMVITVTSHAPYDVYPGEDPPFFPGSHRSDQVYFSAMHYVDAAIGVYIDRLPEGTTLVIYGDHISQIENQEIGYQQVQVDGIGIVPFLVHNVGEDLSGLQRTSASGLATSGELTLLDAVGYVHYWTLNQESPDRPDMAEVSFQSDTAP